MHGQQVAAFSREVSLAGKQAVVVGDPKKATEQAVITAIEAAGYEARAGEADTGSPG